MSRKIAMSVVIALMMLFSATAVYVTNLPGTVPEDAIDQPVLNISTPGNEPSGTSCVGPMATSSEGSECGDGDQQDGGGDVPPADDGCGEEDDSSDLPPADDGCGAADDQQDDNCGDQGDQQDDGCGCNDNSGEGGHHGGHHDCRDHERHHDRFHGRHAGEHHGHRAMDHDRHHDRSDCGGPHYDRMAPHCAGARGCIGPCHCGH